MCSRSKKQLVKNYEGKRKPDEFEELEESPPRCLGGKKLRVNRNQIIHGLTSHLKALTFNPKCNKMLSKNSQ